MDVFFSFLIVTIATGFISYFIYIVSKKKFSRLIKYMPAIASSIGTSLLYIKLKLNLYSKALAGIYDILGIILLFVFLVIFLLMAIFMELRE
ncbi:hypothetical protein [Sutcliffiella rhizosphaerae]|uniref:Uncharacterized protein n=1 Tax=Sutcliffiella rhizosphaerae TaxID=2880967 RepID=A0ABM8YN73_9BACI|nr:hypothetical protein [Sutcliffiella rhizosphaerae]CAG9621213.1 hypothetical protein BACCIP111883_01985 [Sutcliffiella rhizosphaerae]